MAPAWLRLIVSWLGRRRLQRKSGRPPLRRTASEPTMRMAAKAKSASNPYLPLAQHHHTPAYQQHPSYVPAGYAYNTAQGYVNGRRVTVSAASSYPVHLPAGGAAAPKSAAPVTGSTPSAPPPPPAVEPTSTRHRRGHSNASMGKVERINYVAAPPVVLPQHQQTMHYYTLPRQRATTNTSSNANTNTNATSNMIQLPTTPVTTSTFQQGKKLPSTPALSSRPPLRQLQNESAPPLTPRTPAQQAPVFTKPPPPPPPTTTSSRRAARMTRANSAPAGSLPFHASPKRVSDAYMRYAEFFMRGAASTRALSFASICWPVVDAPKHPTSLTVNSVRAFLLSPHHSQGTPARQRIETAQAMWDPEAFMTTFGARIKMKDDRDVVERALHFLQGTLRILHAEVVAAETIGGSP